MPAFTLPSAAAPHLPRLLAGVGWKPRFPWFRRSVAPLSVSPDFTEATATLPPRFDVHCVTSFNHWILKQSPFRTHDVTIEAGLVRFVDAQAVEAILEAKQSLASRGIDLHLSNPSIAFQATLEITSVASLLAKKPTAITSATTSSSSNSSSINSSSISRKALS